MASCSTTAPCAPCPVWQTAQWFILHVCVLGLCGVLAGAFWIQFGNSEYPCPLCILQRMAMILAAMGPLVILLDRKNASPSCFSAFRVGFGISILSAALGACISTRQVLLHIAPGDLGYGNAVMGMHLYTWALVVFMVVIVVSGFMLIFGNETTAEEKPRVHWFTNLTFWIFTAIVAANVLAVFAEAGFNLFLPDDPDAYLLFGSGE